MHQHQRWPFLGCGLPVALAANPRAGFDFEFAGNAGRQAWKSPRQKCRGQRLQVWVAQQPVWFEGLHSNEHLTTESATGGVRGLLTQADGPIEFQDCAFRILSF